MKIIFCLIAVISIGDVVDAQTGLKPGKKLDAAPSCAEYLPPPTAVSSAKGPDECRILSEEKVFNAKGRVFERLELRLSGTLEGWAIKEGRRGNYFNDAPDIVFVQSQNGGRRFKGTGRYEAATGHGISLFFPANAKDWNGKLFVTAHGAGPYGAVGALIPRHPDADFNPLMNVNRFVGLMIDKGYAVAHTLRSAHQQGGDVAAALEDGTTLKVNISTHPGFITAMTKTAENLLRAKLGMKPRKTYYYGFSAGGFLGRMVQYVPGANRDDDGTPLFDGFLLDDAGGGDWRPILVVDGKDTLLLSAEDKQRFVPQIDITHQLDVGENDSSIRKKRENATLLNQKGLTAKHRVYELKGLAHFDAGQASRPDHVAQALDLGGVMDALIDRLDQWVDGGKAPPESRAEMPEFAGALALPEIACPLGVYYAFPDSLGDTLRGSQETNFARFDGINLEPLDARGKVVDMNGNGVRDKRETMEHAWKRLGILKANEGLSRDKYVDCVKRTATALVKDGLLPSRVVNYYVAKAKVTPLLMSAN